MGLNSFHLELTTKCINCGEIIAINAAVKKVWCHKCNGEIKLGKSFYNLLFGEINQLANEMSLGEEHKTVTEEESQGLTRFVFNKRMPICKECKSPLPFPKEEEEKILCTKCNYSHLIRKYKGKKESVFTLIGEDSYQIEESEKKTVFHEPVEFECTNCGGAMKSDGKERLCECPYCSSKIMLPDSLWYRLHPSAHLQPWFLLINIEEEKQKAWEFEGVKDMVYKNGKLFCFGENSFRDYSIWAMTTKYELIWMKVLPEKDIEKRAYSKIEYLEENKLLLWSDELPTALIYNSLNGGFLEEIGGYEPHDADKHYLDLTDCSSLATDPDGTIVALINERIVRFNIEGEGINTWPPKKNLFGIKTKEDLEPLYKNSDQPIRPVYKRRKNKGKFIHPQKMKDQSLIYSSFGGQPTVQIDQEGALYILNSMKLNALRKIVGGAILTKFDRKGEIIYKAELPQYGVNMAQPQIDEKGNVYIIINDASAERERGGILYKVSADGKQIDEIARAHYSILNTQMTSFVVDEQETIYTCDDQAEIRNYNNQGKLIYRNQKAMEKDKELLEE